MGNKLITKLNRSNVTKKSQMKSIIKIIETNEKYHKNYKNRWESNIRNAKLVALSLVNPKNLDILHSVEIISIHSRFRISN